MFENIVNDVAGLPQSAGRLTVEWEVAGSIPAKKGEYTFFFSKLSALYSPHDLSTNGKKVPRVLR